MVTRAHAGANQYTIALFFASLGLLFALFALPQEARAQIPSGCQQTSIGQFHPYIYEGELHSFDYTVTPAAGVEFLPVLTSINGEALSLNYTSVWDEETAQTRIHVDVPFELSGTVSIRVAVIELTDGPPPTCITYTTFTTRLPGSSSSDGGAEEDDSRETGSGGSETDSGNTQPNTPSQPGNIGEEPVTPEEPGGVTGDSDWWAEILSMLTPAGEGQCRSLPLSTWIGLTLINIAIALLIIAYMSFIVRSNWYLASAVLIPFALFLTLWFIFDQCKEHIWFPLLNLLISIAVLWASGTPDLVHTVGARTKHWSRRVTQTAKQWYASAASHVKRWYRAASTGVTSRFGGREQKPKMLHLPGAHRNVPTIPSKNEDRGQRKS